MAASVTPTRRTPEPTDPHAILRLLPQVPEEMVVAFARGKAESLARADALVIGADQIPEIEGRILTKPGSRDAAITRLCRT